MKPKIIFFIVYIGILLAHNSCASSKEIRNNLLGGICDCDTTKGYYLRDFNARLADSLKIWEVPLKKGIRYKFIVFDRNCYKKPIMPLKTVSSFLSIYSYNENQRLSSENFIGSTPKNNELENCFIFDCDKSDIYYLTIQPKQGKLTDRTNCSIGIIYFIKKLN